MTGESKSQAKSEPVAVHRGCPLDRLLRTLSGEWTTHILWVLSQAGPTRYGELKRLVDGISSKVLTDRLRMLEDRGLVFRDHQPTIPPAVTYGLTTDGHKLDEVLRALEKVASRLR